jgi:hypothetical protein
VSRPVNEHFIRRQFGTVTCDYDTHRPVLCEAVLRTSGPILELGMGDGSTRALHAVAMACNRRTFSFDNDSSWFARFMDLRDTWHLLARLDTWDDCPIESTFWSCALVDHAPAERRTTEIKRLAYRAELVVVHDTEDPIYGYDAVFESFAHRHDYRKHRPWTTVLSNYVDLAQWCIDS